MERKTTVSQWMKHLERLLLVVGLGLLAFYGAAKLHEIVLSRAAVHQFENRQPAEADPVLLTPPPTLSAPKPDFLTWSKQRIKHYEASLGQHLSPPLAILRINRIQVEAPVLEGTDELTLNRGVGHIEGTAYFGENGNVGVAGHRDGFFRGLKDIKVGDRIEVEEPGQTETYVVDRLEIADPHDVSVLRSSSTPTLTLVTCYPFYYIGGAPQRFIAHATLVNSETAVNNVPKNHSPGTF
jgi:sortase A